MTNPVVPYHKSEKMFRRYEKAIFAFTKNYPAICWFNPAPFAPTTYSCRLRDSIESLLEYNWTTPIDVNKLREIWPKSQVSPDKRGSGLIGIGPIEGFDKLVEAGQVEHCPVEPPTRDSFAFVLDNPDLAILTATALLLERGILTSPVSVRNISRDVMQQISEKYNVGISETADSFIML